MLYCESHCDEYSLLESWFACEKHETAYKADINKIFIYLGVIGHCAANNYGKEDA